MTELERLLVRAREVSGGTGVYVKRVRSNGVLVRVMITPLNRESFYGIGRTTEEALKNALASGVSGESSGTIGPTNEVVRRCANSPDPATAARSE